MGSCVSGLEGGGPPRWEESWSHACGPGVARPSDSQGWGPSLSVFFSLSPTAGQASLWRGWENHSDAYFGSHLTGTALLGRVTHWLHFTGKAEAEATGGSGQLGAGGRASSLSLGCCLLLVQVDDARRMKPSLSGCQAPPRARRWPVPTGLQSGPPAVSMPQPAPAHPGVASAPLCIAGWMGWS